MPRVPEIDATNSSNGLTGNWDYERGRLDGEVEARLNSHDSHFVTIHGNLAEIKSSLRHVETSVQSLTENAAAEAKARVTTAKALRDYNEQKWQPWVRIGSFLVAIPILYSIFVFFVRGIPGAGS